jgi:hypothetical protein
MASTAEIDATIAALEKVRASGYARVTHEGRTVEYRSLAEIDRALAGLRGQRAAAAGTPVVRRIYAWQDGKGL